MKQIRLRKNQQDNHRWQRSDPRQHKYLPAGHGMQADELEKPKENDPGEQKHLTAERQKPVQIATASQGQKNFLFV
jgi:hypothetical protein